MKALLLTGLFMVSAALSGCWNAKPEQLAAPQASLFTEETPIADVMKDPAFGDYGRLLFPVDNSYYSGQTLGDLHLTYYSHIDPATTVEVVNSLKTRALAGDTVFTTFTPTRKRRRIRPKRMPACFSSGGSLVRGSRSAARAARSPMWAQCTTAFPTRSRFPGTATTRSR